MNSGTANARTIHTKSASGRILKALARFQPHKAALARLGLAVVISLSAFSIVAFGQQSTTTMNGTVQATTVTAGNINNQAQVDGVTNSSLADAVGSPQCFGVSPAPSNGCVIWDGFNEAPFQAWPFLGDHNYRLNMGHGAPPGGPPNGNGIWWTTVPIVLANDQIVGSGRAKNVVDGSTGTVFRACDGDATNTPCNGLYFRNAPPKPTAPVLSSTPAGSLSGTYYAQFVWVVNLATAADSQATASWDPWSATMSVYAGQAINDASNTNCAPNPCTEVALNAGTTGSGTHPTWPAIGQTVQDIPPPPAVPVTWLNIGNYSSTTTQPYGTPGLSLAGSFDAGHTVSSKQIIYAAPNLSGTYPTCTNGTQYGGNDHIDYVLNSTGTIRTFRAVGVGTATTARCNDLNSALPGSQTQGSDDGFLLWQEVGPPLHYLPIAGYLVLVSTTGNPGTGIVQDPSGCSGTPKQVGNLTVCSPTSTYTLSSYSNPPSNPCPPNSAPCGTHSPMIDTTHPLIVLGEQQNGSGSNASFMSRAQDLTADANSIAGEACLYVYAQEQSGCYAMNALSGSEASIAAIGPGSQNAMIWDFVAGNPASGPRRQQRLAGVFIDSRDGAAMKTIAHGTIAPYNPPGAPGTVAVPAGLKYIGCCDITIEGVHTEFVTDGILCDGLDNTSSGRAGCWILSTDPIGVSQGHETNTVHLGPNVGAAFVNTVQGKSTNSLEDETSGAPIFYVGDGTYTLGSQDTSLNHFRTSLISLPGYLNALDGPLFLSNVTSPGSMGFAQGTDTGSVAWPGNTAVLEAPASVSSYRLMLPAGPASGILQGSNSSGVITGTFSGDGNHSIHHTNTSGVITPTNLCPGTTGGCSVPGLYRISFYLYSTMTATCTGTPSVGPIKIFYTDGTGIPKSSVIVPLFSSGTITSSISLSSSTSYAWGTATIWSQGGPSNPIQYEIEYQCNSGTGQYELDATVEQLQSFP